ncbi:Neuroligin-1 [Frankliniella fusca]|uniref:Neuroligin-1 n=1 Tax=Frankliniella fusca TaxID=407009 RepID=A0AAE1HSZ6_9NEOP|nr:Neuroligin-1 [Frankliniella fusca]
MGQAAQQPYFKSILWLHGGGGPLPVAGQLFHRAVLMSGSALAPGALVRDPGTQARAVARIANCSDDLPARFLLACLRERPLSALVAAVEAAAGAAAGADPSASGAGASAFGGGALAVFGPSVDGVVIDAGEEPAAPEHRSISGDRQAPSGLGLGLGSSLGRRPGAAVPGAAGVAPGAAGAGGPLRPGLLPGVGMGLGLGGGASGITPDPVMDLVLRKAVEARLSRYALLLGVVRAEAFLAFSSADEQFGLEADRRTRILRTFVRNTYRYHRSEILATILNEYTDWERPVQHPVNLRDETLEALSDAQVVAPVVLTADVHSNTAANKTFLYVFDYQTKYGDYQQVRLSARPGLFQRQGCIHGEDLAYVLGAPLSAGLRHSHLPRNFTKSEAMLSEATMNYWINFARTGNPNDPIEPSRGGRHRSLEWPPYENLHKYIVLEPKPRIKSHYRAHRLSFWLHLVPELHRPGGEGVPLGHHQMPGDPPDPPMPPAPPPGPGRGRPPAEPKPDNATRDAANTTRVVTADPKQRAPAPAPEPQPNPPGTGEGAAGIPPPAPDPTPSAGGSDDGFAAYSTALSATVAIGCSLLLLNVLVFACVYHQREKGVVGLDGGSMPIRPPITRPPKDSYSVHLSSEFLSWFYSSEDITSSVLKICPLFVPFFIPIRPIHWIPQDMGIAQSTAPRYPPDLWMWNQHLSARHNAPRSNNTTKAWHNRFQTSDLRGLQPSTGAWGGCRGTASQEAEQTIAKTAFAFRASDMHETMVPVIKDKITWWCLCLEATVLFRLRLAALLLRPSCP